MKTVRITAILLTLVLAEWCCLPAAAAERAAAPQVTADQIAMMLDRLHAPAAPAIVRTGGSCTTSCGPGPEGSCSKSCSGAQSCSATCAGGKAVCRCE